jgi:predicted PurR-regulated permease PerM
MTVPDKAQPQLPPPWDRIFGLGTRIFVWGLFFGVIYLLRSFFLLVFLTFVFAYIQAHGVKGIEHRIQNRPARVVVVFGILLATIVAIGFFVVPHLKAQIETIAHNYKGYLRLVDTEVVPWVKETFRLNLPPDLTTEALVASALGFGAEGDGHATIRTWIDWAKNTGGWLLGIGSAFLLSLLFSFLIVLDMPKLARGLRGLQKTKLGFIYDEVAGSVYGFCTVLGRALEAQLFIALLNTFLTAIGMWIMGLSNIVFLSTVVFFCSFIPVAGVFLSSTPICIVALQVGGLKLMLIAIGLILLIHFIEAYILNPRIFGHHLHMNPVLVLIVLTIAGKLFGVWGLVLGLPVVNYVFRYAIRREPNQPSALAA